MTRKIKDSTKILASIQEKRNKSHMTPMVPNGRSHVRVGMVDILSDDFIIKRDQFDITRFRKMGWCGVDDCGLPQYHSPSGPVCKNGHGGALTLPCDPKEIS